MAITLTNGTTTIILPNDLQWEDEYTWSKNIDQLGISLTGSLVIQSSSRVKGRNITLMGGDDYAWMTKADIDNLFVLIDAGLNMTLTLNDGSQFNVRFRYDETILKYDPVAPNKDIYNNISIALREV